MLDETTPPGKGPEIRWIDKLATVLEDIHRISLESDKLAGPFFMLFRNGGFDSMLASSLPEDLKDIVEKKRVLEAAIIDLNKALYKAVRNFYEENGEELPNEYKNLPEDFFEIGGR